MPKTCVPLLVLGAYSTMAARRWADNAPTGAMVLQWDGLLEMVSDRADLKAMEIGTFVGLKDFLELDKFCAEWLVGWYRPRGKDYSTWDGSSLGLLLAGYALVGNLMPVLQNVLLARRVLEELMPSRLILGKGVQLEEQIWRREAWERGIEVESLTIDPPLKVDAEWMCVEKFQTWASLRWGRRSLRKMRRWCSRRYAWIEGEGRPDISSPRVTIAIQDAQVYRELLRLGIRKIPDEYRRIKMDGWDRGKMGWLFKSTNDHALPLAKREFAERWPSLVSELPDSPLAKFVGIGIWSFLTHLVEESFLNKLPKMAAELEAARAVLRAKRPALLVSQLIWGESRGVWREAARQERVPVVGVQREQFYNETVSSYLPNPNSDWVLTIGATSNHWFELRGVPPERMIMVGDPKRKNILKQFATVDPKKIRIKYRLGDKPVILFADGRYSGTAGNEWPGFFWYHLALIKKIAKALPEVWVVVKFHPGSSNSEKDDYLQRRVNYLRDDALPNLMLAPFHSKALSWLSVCNIVVSDGSALGLEAILLNIPAVFLRTKDAGFYQLDYRDGLEGAFGIKDEADLLAKLQYILNNYTKIRNTINDNFNKFVTKIYGQGKETFFEIVNILEDQKRGNNPCASIRLNRNSP